MTSCRNTKQCHPNYYIAVFTTAVPGDQRWVISSLHVNHPCITGTNTTWSFKLNSKEHVKRTVCLVFVINLPLLIFRRLSWRWAGLFCLQKRACRATLLAVSLQLGPARSLLWDKREAQVQESGSKKELSPQCQAGARVASPPLTQFTFCFWCEMCVCSDSVSLSFPLFCH